MQISKSFILKPTGLLSYLKYRALHIYLQSRIEYILSFNVSIISKYLIPMHNYFIWIKNLWGSEEL